MGYCVKNYEVKINLMFLEIKVDYVKIWNKSSIVNTFQMCYYYHSHKLEKEY